MIVCVKRTLIAAPGAEAGDVPLKVPDSALRLGACRFYSRVFLPARKAIFFRRRTAMLRRPRKGYGPVENRPRDILPVRVL